MDILKIYLSKITIFASILCLTLLFSCNQKSTRKTVILNEGWEFYYPKTQKWYPATVPCNIHTDLYANGLINDPFSYTNTEDLKWISEQEWKYRKSFDIAPEFINRNLELVFDGIDTHAEIFLNGVKLGNTENMYRQWTFIVSDSIRKKENNLIEVILHPSSKYNSENASNWGYSIPDNRIYSRKAPYQYGWDWAPNLETCGIYKDVYLNSWEKLRISNVRVDQKILTDTIAVLVAQIEIESENYYNGDVKIFNPDHQFDSLSQELEIFEGKRIYPIEFRIKNPKLWWCNNMGNPNMYEIKIQVSTKFRVEEKILKIGLRNIELCTNTDKTGQEFYFLLNGTPVFARGANWVPAEYFNSSNNEKKYEQLLSMAKDANFNMLRVWGGGIYENDEFYNICDSLGIMVWQDFMFACAMYPLNDGMKQNITEEVKYQVNRLYNHPSIVLWCGNNEISNAWFDWGWQKQFNITEEDSVKIWNDYDNLFHRIIPKAISSIDKSRTYIPSSPSFGWGRKESITNGDNHYWGVWWGMEKFEKYFENTGRFMSEYGFQALPSWNSLNKFIPKDSLFLNSESLKSHQKHPFGFKAIDEYMRREYPVPTYLEDYVFVSQILQAEGIQKAFDAHISARPYCMGTLFWQFNDCWPSISWSAVDYYMQPKALYYFAKRAFANISICAFNKDKQFNVFAVNHTQNTLNVKAVLEVSDFYGNIVESDSIIFILNQLTSNKISFDSTINTAIMAAGDSCFIDIKLYDFNTEKLITDRIVVIGKNKNLKFSSSEFKYNCVNHGNYWEIGIQSKVFIKNLYVYATNSEGKFSDNYFNLRPNEKISILYFPKVKTEQLDLKFNSMNQIVLKTGNSFMDNFKPNKRFLRRNRIKKPKRAHSD